MILVIAVRGECLTNPPRLAPHAEEPHDRVLEPPPGHERRDRFAGHRPAGRQEPVQCDPILLRPRAFRHIDLALEEREQSGDGRLRVEDHAEPLRLVGERLAEFVAQRSIGRLLHGRRGDGQPPQRGQPFSLVLAPGERDDADRERRRLAVVSSRVADAEKRHNLVPWHRAGRFEVDRQVEREPLLALLGNREGDLLERCVSVDLRIQLPDDRRRFDREVVLDLRPQRHERGRHLLALGGG